MAETLSAQTAEQGAQRLVQAAKRAYLRRPLASEPEPLTQALEAWKEEAGFAGEANSAVLEAVFAGGEAETLHTLFTYPEWVFPQGADGAVDAEWQSAAQKGFRERLTTLGATTEIANLDRDRKVADWARQVVVDPIVGDSAIRPLFEAKALLSNWANRVGRGIEDLPGAARERARKALPEEERAALEVALDARAQNAMDPTFTHRNPGGFERVEERWTQRLCEVTPDPDLLYPGNIVALGPLDDDPVFSDTDAMDEVIAQAEGAIESIRIEGGPSAVRTAVEQAIAPILEHWQTHWEGRDLEEVFEAAGVDPRAFQGPDIEAFESLLARALPPEPDSEPLAPGW